MDGHDHKWCFVDPASVAYKPEVRERRIRAAKRKGITLPDYLQDEDPKKGAVAAVQPGLAEDLVGALRMVPGLEDDEIEDFAGAILDGVGGPHMVAQFQHESDGNTPQQVFSIGPGGDLQAIPPSTCDRLMQGWVPDKVGLGAIGDDGDGEKRLQLQAVT